jgi:hypothetical protein
MAPSLDGLTAADTLELFVVTGRYSLQESMRNYIVQFDTAVARQINDHVRLATQIWKTAGPNLESVRIAAGSVASYGRHLANCSATGLIQIPVGNQFSLLTYSPENTLIHKQADETELLGTLLHELGHHVVNTAKQKPWKGRRSAHHSTHMQAAWLWVCATGWNHMHQLGIQPDDIATSIRLDKAADEQDQLGWVQACQCFNPYRMPPALLYADSMTCQNCGDDFTAARSDAKFCSTRCRVSWNRKQSRDEA